MLYGFPFDDEMLVKKAYASDHQAQCWLFLVLVFLDDLVEAFHYIHIFVHLFEVDIAKKRTFVAVFGQKHVQLASVKLAYGLNAVEQCFPTAAYLARYDWPEEGIELTSRVCYFVDFLDNQ
jgi:hypothetical protein